MIDWASTRASDLLIRENMTMGKENTSFLNVMSNRQEDRNHMATIQTVNKMRELVAGSSSSRISLVSLGGGVRFPFAVWTSESRVGPACHP